MLTNHLISRPTSFRRFAPKVLLGNDSITKHGVDILTTKKAISLRGKEVSINYTHRSKFLHGTKTLQKVVGFSNEVSAAIFRPNFYSNDIHPIKSMQLRCSNETHANAQLPYQFDFYQSTPPGLSASPHAPNPHSIGACLLFAASPHQRLTYIILVVIIRLVISLAVLRCSQAREVRRRWRWKTYGRHSARAAAWQ